LGRCPKLPMKTRRWRALEALAAAITPTNYRFRDFFVFAFAGRLPLAFGFAAFFGPRKIRAGRSLMAARLNFRAARRAPSFPPYPLSLNNRVTVSLPRRKCT